MPAIKLGRSRYFDALDRLYHAGLIERRRQQVKAAAATVRLDELSL